ncbi:glycine cleavage system protein T, partial [Halobacteriales archaeon QS_1_68_17]
YVGELGWELHTSTEYGYRLWDRLWEAGREYDAVPMGDGALNTMRLEKGYGLYGADLTSEYDPYEAGLGFAVDPETAFIGREALDGAADPDRRLAALTLDEGNRVPTAGVPFFDGDDRVGYATSSDYGYSVGECILYGYLPAEYDPGTGLTVQYENEQYDATVREDPLFDPERERLLR